MIMSNDKKKTNFPILDVFIFLLGMILIIYVLVLLQQQPETPEPKMSELDMTCDQLREAYNSKLFKLVS